MLSRNSVLGLFLAALLMGIVGVMTAFAFSLNPSAEAKAIRDSNPIAWQKLSLGIPHVIARFNQHDRVVLLRPTTAQLQHLDELDAHVFNPTRKNWNEAGFFMYCNYAPNLPITLKYYDPGQSPISERVKANSKWFGGWYENLHGQSFDIAGRAIRDAAFAPLVGLRREGDLHQPRYRLTRNQEIILTQSGCG